MLKYAARRFQGEAGFGPDLGYIQPVIHVLEWPPKGLYHFTFAWESNVQTGDAP
jgi:hypothetical protein